MPKYELVLFDVDHTLAFDNKLELTVLHEMCDELEVGVEEVTKRDIMKHFDQGAKIHFDKIRSGQMKIEDAMTEQFHYLARKLTTTHKHLNPHELAVEYMNRVCQKAIDYLRVVPGVPQIFTDLKAGGYQVAILTNGWTKLQLRKAEIIGFDGPVFVSDDLGSWKPDKRIFDTAAGKMKVTKAESVLMVGDSATADIAGAKKAGMHAVWVNEEGEHFPEGLPAPNYEIRHLEELLHILL